MNRCDGCRSICPQHEISFKSDVACIECESTVDLPDVILLCSSQCPGFWWEVNLDREMLKIHEKCTTCGEIIEQEVHVSIEPNKLNQTNK